MNEGDPVVRAERGYVRSLVDLLACPDPKMAEKCHKCTYAASTVQALQSSISKLDLALSGGKTGKVKPHRHEFVKEKLWWDVPPATLSNAGRLVVLRVEKGKRREEGVKACVVTDEQLRKVMFGDPVMHQMDVYARRVEALAVKAVTGKLQS